MTLLSAGPLLLASTLAFTRLARPVALFGRIAPSLSLAWAGLAVMLWVIRRAARDAGRETLAFLILVAFSADAFLWLLWAAMRPLQLRADLVWSGLILSMLLAGYPALRIQARRRELWPLPLAFAHRAAQAFLAGASVLVITLAYLGGSRSSANVLLRCVLGGVCAHGALLLLGIALSHRQPARGPAVGYMLSGPLATRFWVLAVLMGVALPTYILVFHFARPALSGLWGAIAATLAVLGLLAYQDCCASAAREAPAV